MTTCNRCGKENQDHYKFCLGCGNEIKAAAAKPDARSVARDPIPMETARTMLPQEGASRAAAQSTISLAAAAPVSSVTAPESSLRTSVSVC